MRNQLKEIVVCLHYRLNVIKKESNNVVIMEICIIINILCTSSVNIIVQLCMYLIKVEFIYIEMLCLIYIRYYIIAK